MVAEELAAIQQIGIDGAAFVLIYLLLKRMQEKSFEQSDKMITFAENVVKENTKTLQQMRDLFEEHMKAKEPLIEEFKECRRERNESLRRIEVKMAG